MSASAIWPRDLLVALDDDLARLRVGHGRCGEAADDALSQRLEDGAVLRLAEPDAGERLAVVVEGDHVLRDVDETARQVAGVGCTERRVGETLAGAVRGDEVLQHGRPSRKFERIGSSMMRPEGSDIRPRIPAIWRIWVMLPLAPDVAMRKTEPYSGRRCWMRARDLFGGAVSRRRRSPRSAPAP